MLRSGYRRLNFFREALTILAPVILAFAADAQTANPTVTPTPLPNREIHRWFDIEDLRLSTRYRYLRSNAGMTLSNQQQWQVNGRARFKFDKNGNYSVVAAIETGNTINGGWNNTGWGTGDLQTNVYLKQLYFDAKPFKSLEIQFGGLGVNNGENTEITGYDNDAYLMGERIIFRNAGKLWFDEISATNGFVGDIDRPNVFRRFIRLGRSNYHQLLVRKKINSRVGFSADYTFDAGTDTLREAVKATLKELKFVDTLLFENYQRLDPDAGYGFALTGDKRINSRFNIVGGFAKISHQMINGDRYPRGERVFLSGVYKIFPELSLNPIIIQGVGPLATPAAHRTRFEFIVTYNILEALHRHHIF